jgi:ABC-2 type transport system ATP-binding protein
MYPLEIVHLTKRYGKDVVVDDLTFTVPPGRVTGFLVGLCHPSGG